MTSTVWMSQVMSQDCRKFSGHFSTFECPLLQRSQAPPHHLSLRHGFSRNPVVLVVITVVVPTA